MNRERWHLLSGLLSALCFAGVAVVISHSDSNLKAPEYLFARALFAVVAMLPFTIKTFQVGRDLNPYALLRGLISTFVFLISYWLIQRIGAGPGRAISASHPIFVQLIGIAFLREKLTPKQLVALVIFVNAILVALWPNQQTLEPFVLAIGLFGALLAGISLALLKLSVSKSPEAVILFIFGVVQLNTHFVLSQFDSFQFLQVNYSLIFGAGLWMALAVGALACGGQLLLTHSFKVNSAFTGSLLSLSSIPITFSIEYLYFGKIYSASELITSLLILTSIGLSFKK